MSAAAPREAPTVSVIMPCFNAPPSVLREALASVRAQTFTNFECLIVDESTDPATTAECLAQCAADSRLVCLRPAVRIGLAGSLNLAIGESRGVLIARFDADDICAPDRLALQVVFLRDHPEVGVLGGALEIIDDAGHATAVRKYPLADTAIRRRMSVTNAIAHPTVMLRRAVLERHGLYDPDFRYCEDLDLWLRLLDARVVFANLPQSLVRYRQANSERAAANWRYNLRARLRRLTGRDFVWRLAGLAAVRAWSLMPARARRPLYRAVILCRDAAPAPQPIMLRRSV